MSVDVKDQVMTEIKSSSLFFLQLDESTDVSSCSQLLVFVRYIHSGAIKDEFLFFSAPETKTKALDMTEKVSCYFHEEGLQWENVWGFYGWSAGYAGIEVRIPIESEEVSTSSQRHPLNDPPICSLHSTLVIKKNVANCVFEMKFEIKLFLEVQEKKVLVAHFEDEA
ncbi:zinc finger MYM-type protein 6-like [Palaemon carinicauda]|uniref:zinc finger MYM-type protein 6-like n=1 Tax=Palaemon carinicauda TaxID=392227 RepID=UPI0035B60DDA